MSPAPTLDLEKIREELELNRRALEESAQLLREVEERSEDLERRVAESAERYRAAIRTLRRAGFLTHPTRRVA